MSLITFGRVTLVVTGTWTVWVVVRLYQARFLGLWIVAGEELARSHAQSN
jgi:hypothetical protein